MSPICTGVINHSKVIYQTESPDYESRLSVWLFEFKYNFTYFIGCGYMCNTRLI